MVPLLSRRAVWLACAFLGFGLLAQADVAPTPLSRIDQQLSQVGARDRGFVGMWRIGGKTSKGVAYEGFLFVEPVKGDAYKIRGSTRFPDGNALAWVGTGKAEGPVLHLRYESRTGGKGEGEFTLLSSRSGEGRWKSLGATGLGGEEILVRDNALERKHLARMRADLEESACAPLATAPVIAATPTRPFASSDGKLRVALSPLCDGTLAGEWVRFIDAAQKTLDVAVFELNIPAVADALLRARERGVEVRLVFDTENDGPEFARLQKNGIPAVGDARKAYMHNKFMVADGTRVLTGSFNPTKFGEVKSDNNVVTVESAVLAKQYATEFAEMFVDRRFGIKSPRNTSSAPIRLSRTTTVRVLFAPEDGVKQAMLEVLRNAKESIDFMSFSINERSIASTLVDKHLAGLRVRGVVERFKSGDKAYSQDAFLREAGVPVRIDRSTNLLHHKVILVDGETVVMTGSYNFSESAERSNDENLLMIFNKEAARQYLADFERTWERAEDPSRRPDVVDRLDLVKDR